ncbi:MAG TPA: uroporphyrinogen-III C-methyltransferase [Burkholderiales bacterium]|nr:uroporphyrinogen-III C-methyltransferase [Burkholderiales bacterium]
MSRNRWEPRARHRCEVSLEERGTRVRSAREPRGDASRTAWPFGGARGIVYLVGAGPGDPDLLTLRAARLMRSVDAVVYDYLVSDAVLALVDPRAERIYAGKRQGCHALAQDEINKLLVALARRGRRVLRLKGGDPFVFGRGGEECEFLAEHGVPFEVVPGVTSASGASCYAGIPLTHREHARAVVFATGHRKDGSSDLDWETLARPHQTVVIYMGLTRLAEICRELIARGASPSLPAAVVERATTERQRVVTGTLRDLPGLAARAGVRPPSLVIVGEVVRLREALGAFDADAKRLASRLEFAHA